MKEIKINLEDEDFASLESLNTSFEILEDFVKFHILYMIKSDKLDTDLNNVKETNNHQLGQLRESFNNEITSIKESMSFIPEPDPDPEE